MISKRDSSDYKFSFSTQSYNEFDSTAFMIANTPVNINATEATKKLYTFLKDNFGKKMISAAMANPSLNKQMADTIYAKTGKYPAINCFDFVHHIYSSPLNPSNWIDYTNTSVEENWWKNGGIVVLCGTGMYRSTNTISKISTNILSVLTLQKQIRPPMLQRLLLMVHGKNKLSTVISKL